MQRLVWRRRRSFDYEAWLNWNPTLGAAAQRASGRTDYTSGHQVDSELRARLLHNLFSVTRACIIK
jgi:hypothetical protein